MTYELGQLAIKGLVSKTGIDPKEVEKIWCQGLCDSRTLKQAITS